MFREFKPEGYPEYRKAERVPLSVFNSVAASGFFLPVVELVITDPQIESVFLLPRVGGQFDGLWHVPGGYRGGNSSSVALEEVAQRELGRSLADAHIKWLGHLENAFGDDRGPLDHEFFRINGLPPIEIEGGAYFRRLPKRIIPHHRYYLTELANAGHLPIEP